MKTENYNKEKELTTLRGSVEEYVKEMPKDEEVLNAMLVDQGKLGDKIKEIEA
jgi:hypothetical protein